ncbi:MAG TPA: ribosome biogenesis GTPase YlqF [Clostridiales bacterium]|nr:ribosome biogenesis GTPase YlqF [Clostridiales bacterium]
MSEVQNIQWFPGHMAKTRRLISQSLKLVDAVAEIIDARIPVSSRNPELAGIIANKPLIVILNKSDLADPDGNAAWVQYFKSRGNSAITVDCKTGKGLNAFKPAVMELLKDKLERYKSKGMVGKPLRLMVVGIPNVGKSSFINRMARNAKAKVEDRPGVTRGNQWYSIDRQLELLDTPGILWPKFEDPLVGERLAFTGAVKDDVVDIETLAVRLISCLKPDYANLLESWYKVTLRDLSDYEILCEIARRRGMLSRGGEADTERAAAILLDEFRSGKLGRITLELPEMYTEEENA